MGKRIARCTLIIVLSVGLSGCISYKKTDEETRVHSLGIASAEECAYYEGREDGMVMECTTVETDAFSGWKEIMDGIGNIAVKIITFGFKGD